MNPSSPSNADGPAGAAFKVSTRALTADCLAARIDESSRELGSIDAAALGALLHKLAALDPAEVAEADPQLIATGRRGRFAIRPVRGHFLLRSVTDAGQNFIELAAEDVASFLDARELGAAAPVEVPSPVTPVRGKESRRALGFGLIAVSGLVLALSAWLTFRTDEIDPESDYQLVAATSEVAALRKSLAGTFVSGSGDDERTLEIAPEGDVRYREYGPGRALADNRIGPSTVARRRADKALVLRVKGLGTVEVKGTDAVMFARDSYQRSSGAPSTEP